jgi:hypothetical protein
MLDECTCLIPVPVNSRARAWESCTADLHMGAVNAPVQRQHATGNKGVNAIAVYEAKWPMLLVS